MLRLFKRKKVSPLTDFSSLKTDIHSHLIPGIDDGADTLERSIHLIKGLKALGFQKLITTPHIMVDHYPNTRETIMMGLADVKKALTVEGIDIEMEAAAEYMMDEHFERLLNNEPLLTFGENYVLVEMGFISAPPGLYNYIFKLRTKGYTPILAHPERYLFLKDGLEQYEKLKEYGCKFQLNILSFLGYYGKPTKERAIKLLKHGLIDFLGTDLHHHRHFENLKDGIANKRLQSLLQNHTFANTSL